MLDAHIIDLHETTDTSVAVDFACGQCNLSFTDSDELAIHLNTY